MVCSRRAVLIVLRRLALAACAVLIARPARPQPEMVVHKEGTALYHWPGCPAVRDTRGVLALMRAQAAARGLKPHPACDPSRKPAPPPRSEQRPAPPDPPVTVYVEGPKYYHRKSCPKLDAASIRVRAVRLEAASKTHWPCPACKPPIVKRSTEPAVPGTNRRRGG